MENFQKLNIFNKILKNIRGIFEKNKDSDKINILEKESISKRKFLERSKKVKKI